MAGSEKGSTPPQLALLHLSASCLTWRRSGGDREVLLVCPNDNRLLGRAYRVSTAKRPAELWLAIDLERGMPTVYAGDSDPFADCAKTYFIIASHG